MTQNLPPAAARWLGYGVIYDERIGQRHKLSDREAEPEKYRARPPVEPVDPKCLTTRGKPRTKTTPATRRALDQQHMLLSRFPIGCEFTSLDAFASVCAKPIPGKDFRGMKSRFRSWWHVATRIWLAAGQIEDITGDTAPRGARRLFLRIK